MQQHVHAGMGHPVGPDAVPARAGGVPAPQRADKPAEFLSRHGRAIVVPGVNDEPERPGTRLQRRLSKISPAVPDVGRACGQTQPQTEAQTEEGRSLRMETGANHDITKSGEVPAVYSDMWGGISLLILLMPMPGDGHVAVPST